MKIHLAEKKAILILNLVIAGSILGGCGKSLKQDTDATMKQVATEEELTQAASEDTTTEGAVTFTDALGREVTVKHPQKVAAVMGSFANVWLLAGGNLTAVTNDFYEESNTEVNNDIVNLGEMKSPDMEQLLAANVDFVILSSKIDEHVALQNTLEKAGIACAYFEVETVDDYLAMLKTCTDITGDTKSYQKNGEAVKEQIESIIASVPKGEQPKVLFLRAFSTGVKAKGSDNMTGAMLKDLGCINIADGEDSLLEDLSIEKIIEEDPDYIFVVTMGSSEEDALAVVQETLIDNPVWGELTAVKENHYVVLPKDLFHLKPNNRWGESYQMLADILYGE